MNWFRQNRFLGTFLIASGLATLGALWFLFSAKTSSDEASARFNQDAADLSRLQGLAPYPNGANLRQMKLHAEDYAGALTKLKEELKTRAFPISPLAPNEFQSHLRVAMGSVAEKARANKVKLPENFFLGFDEFASALPNTAVAPLLGQELTQVEWLLNMLIDARVDSLTVFRRAPLPEEHGTTTAPTPAAGRKAADVVSTDAKMIERNAIEATFISTPASARKVLNQIAGASQQFFIIRLLHVRNEKDKGPAREVVADSAGANSTSPTPAGSPSAKPSAGTALNFIVGNERIETSLKIEIVKFTF